MSLVIDYWIEMYKTLKVSASEMTCIVLGGALNSTHSLTLAPFEFFAPSSLLHVASWLHPFAGHCEQEAVRGWGLFMSLVVRYWIGDVQDSRQGVSISQNANYNF